MKSAIEKLERLYQTVEGFECQGKCQAYCGTVPFSKAEAERAGVEGPQFNDSLECNHLTGLGTCAIYENRPLLCRLFGAIDTPLMRCPHGCKPVLTELEGRKITRQYNVLMEAGQ